MRRTTILAIAVVTAIGAAPVFGQTTVQQRFVSELRQQGFGNLKISRTWLGRVRITAQSKDYKRELVFNPNSGEILRDYWEPTRSGAAKTDEDSRKDKKQEATGLLNPEDSAKSDLKDNGGQDVGKGDGGGDGGDAGGGGGDGGHGGGDGGDGDGGDSSD